MGHVEAGIAGGAESLSDVPILHSRRMARILVQAQKARSLGARLSVLAKLRPRDFIPQTPAIAEPSTGLTMGQSAEKMAKENGISREEQDEIALASHRNATAATEDGRLPAETCAVRVPPRYEVTVREDNLLRKDTSLEALAALKPVFDRRCGTVTAGNSSALTDGAAAVLLMSEETARAEGREAAGLRQGLGGVGGRPRGAAPHGAGSRGAPGARAVRPGARGHGPHRDARGLRRAGGFQYPGAGVRDLGTGEAGPLGAGGQGRPGRGSTCAAARSPSVTRSAPPGPESRPPWPTKWLVAMRNSD